MDENTMEIFEAFWLVFGAGMLAFFLLAFVWWRQENWRIEYLFLKAGAINNGWSPDDIESAFGKEPDELTLRKAVLYFAVLFCVFLIIMLVLKTRLG